MEDASNEKEQQIIDQVLPEESQGFIIEYFLNGLFGDNKAFTKGLTYQDYDIIISTEDAEDEKIFNSLNICNTKYDPETAPSRKVLVFEDLEEVVQPFLNGKELALKDFPEVTLHIYPKIRRNLKFNIASLTYKMVKEENGQKCVVDYKMEHENNNPDNKDILCICTFKLDGKKHKLEKFLQLLEQFNDPTLQEFWDYHRIAYIIFCVKEEKEILNMYAFNDYGKNFFFHLNSDNMIYRADDMLCSGDIIENSIKRKKKEKEEKEKNRNKTKQQLIDERNEAFFTFWNFLKNIKDYKYVLYLSFQFEICLRLNEELKFTINYIDFAHLIAELRTKEYNIIKKCAEVFNPDYLDLEEIQTIDIHVDFSQKECFRCSKMIPDNEDMYYCYKCQIRYCSECVWINFRTNKGKNKFIDSKHNLLYFKTRDPNQFKNIDKNKLGKDLFSQCFNDSQLVQHSAICNGCKQGFDNSPRYLCLNCRSGKVHPDGYYDYCYNCVQDMMKKTPKGIEMQKLEERLYSDETRILYNAKETFRHENDKHVYLMIALQYNCNEQPYYEF